MKASIQRLLNWRTALGELFIVVIGVIIALAVDSWWDRRQEAAAELDHLLALETEFVANLESLNSTMARLTQFEQSARMLIEIVEGHSPPPAPDSMATLVWTAFSFTTYEPISTAYDNLLATGQVGLLTDEGLKRDLALFRSQVEAHHRGDWLLDQWNRVIQQYVNLHFGFDWVVASYREEYNLPEPVSKTDWATTIADEEFRGIIINRHLAVTDFKGQLAEVVPTAERIVSVLDELVEEGANGASRDQL